MDNFRLLFAYASSRDNRHRIYMYFQDRKGWHRQFLEAELNTSLPLKLHFKSANKVIELIERGGGIKDQESRLMLNQAIATGRGGVFPNLTEEQYGKLKRCN